MRCNGFQGKLYAVNPNHAEIQGYQAFTSIEHIPGPVDLAVIITRAALVPGIIEECGKRGVRFALVLSAGFRETGTQGALLERTVIELRDEVVASDPQDNPPDGPADSVPLSGAEVAALVARLDEEANQQPAEVGSNWGASPNGPVVE